MSNWTERIRQVWADRRLDAYRAHREDRRPQIIQELPGYQRLDLRNEETRLDVPRSVLDAYDFYVNSVEAGDYGSVLAFKETFQDLDVFAVEVGTDGSDGWLELFDQNGQSIGAARTSQERIAWGETGTIRAYTQNGGLPVDLRTRRTTNDCFNDEQEARVSECFQKWKQICFLTGKIDRHAASETVKTAYRIAGFAVEPELIFCDSPYAAYKPIIDEIKNEVTNFSLDEFSRQFPLKLENYLSDKWSVQLLQQLVNHLEGQVNAQVNEQLRRELFTALDDLLWGEQVELLIGIIEQNLAKEMWSDLQVIGVPWVSVFSSIRKYVHRCTIRREVLCRRIATLDVYISVLGCTHDVDRWSILQALACSCGWLIPQERRCIASNFPVRFSFDHEGKLHASEEPAIQFSDGFSVYAEHGSAIRTVTNTV